MAVYKIALRANGAEASAPPPNSGLQQDDEGAKGKSQSDNLTELSSGSAKSMTKFRVDQTITPQYRQQLYQKTVGLIVARSVLNKKLGRAFSQKRKFSHKLLNRHYRLKRQESKHLAARTRLAVQLQNQQKLDPSPERAKNIRLLKKLLRTFKRHLRSDTYAHKTRCLRRSPTSSISTSPSSSDMDEHESAISNAILSIATEKLSSEMMAVHGTARKRRASQLSDASLASLFAEHHREQADKDIDGALAVPKQIKKPKLDLEDIAKPTETAPTGTQSVDDANVGKVEGSPGNDANIGPKADQKTPPPASPASANLEADKVEKEANTSAGALPPPTKSKVEEKEEPSCAGALAAESPAEPEVDDEKKKTGDNAPAVASPATSTTDAKEKSAGPAATTSSSPTKSVTSDKERKVADVSVSPSKKAKKHPLESDDNQTKAKKAKVECFATPAVSPKSPRKNVPAAPLKYHEQVVYDMLNDPLGFDDLVYDDARPLHKRPKFGRFGFRYKKPAPNFSPLMYGGIGKDLPQEAKSTLAAAPKPRKPLPSGRKEEEKITLTKGDSLTQQVLQKNYRDRMTHRVQESKAAAAAADQKTSSALDKLTEKPKYSINKEARYAKNDSNQNLELPGLARAGLTRPIPKQAQRDGPKPKTYVSAARRKHNAVRQVGAFR